MEETIKWIKNVLDQAPIPVRVIKRLIYQNLNMDLLSSLDLISSHMAFARTVKIMQRQLRQVKKKESQFLKGNNKRSINECNRFREWYKE